MRSIPKGKCQCGCGQKAYVKTNGEPSKYAKGHARRARTLPDGRRVCTECNKPKHPDEFHKSSRVQGGVRGQCKKCVAERMKRDYHKNPDRWKRYRLKTIYGISLEEFERLLKKQRHRCAICRKKKELHVDHCHRKGNTRGLLCGSCNMALGAFNDNYKTLERAIDYLKG